MRSSRYIPPRAATNFIQGVRFASEIGRPLTTMVTINYGLTAVEEHDMAAAFERLRDNFFCKWFGRHPIHAMENGRGPPTFVWMAEGRKGHHGVHWLVHLRPGMHKAFERLMLVWLQKTAGTILDPKALHIQKVATPLGAAKYLLKGLSPARARRFKVTPSWQGEVFGKRGGVSKNLGPAAIARFRGSAATGATATG